MDEPKLAVLQAAFQSLEGNGQLAYKILESGKATRRAQVRKALLEAISGPRGFFSPAAFSECDAVRVVSQDAQGNESIRTIQVRKNLAEQADVLHRNLLRTVAKDPKLASGLINAIKRLPQHAKSDMHAVILNAWKGTPQSHGGTIPASIIHLTLAVARNRRHPHQVTAARNLLDWKAVDEEALRNRNPALKDTIRPEDLLEAGGKIPLAPAFGKKVKAFQKNQKRMGRAKNQRTGS